MAQRDNFTTPVGRLVMGSLYDPQSTDADGKPLVIKNGPNAGQTRINYFFALAIPKGAERHWGETTWGQIIWANGNLAFPNIAQSPDFAWKIEDGDSQKVNKKGKRPCDNEGWPGNWVLKFSGGFAPKVYRQENGGYVQVLEKDFIKPGYFMEVAANVEGNKSSSQPGVYLNHSMVCFRAYGQEIQFGPDVNSAGFGSSPLPVGASATPPAGAIPMPGAAPVAPAGIPQVPGAAPAIPVASIPQVPGAAPAIPVVPNTNFAQVPPPAPAPVHQMTAAANGLSYESYIAAGWTDALLVQHGMMLA